MFVTNPAQGRDQHELCIKLLYLWTHSNLSHCHATVQDGGQIVVAIYGALHIYILLKLYVQK
jgi:uncharacterized protein YeaC (DUF1315 family)